MDPTRMLTSSTVHTAVPSRISVSAVTAGPVLARVFGILGARAGLSLDRVSDLLLAADTIADADVHADGLARVEFVVSEGQVELLIGPLADGGAERLVDVPRVGGVAVLPRLADEVEIIGTDGSHRVRIVFS
jgi:hypothetical protein